MWRRIPLSLLLLAGSSLADTTGHAKLRLEASDLPADSLFRQFVSSPAVDSSLELRLNVSERRDGFSFTLDATGFIAKGDRLRYSRALGDEAVLYPDDARRWLDLSTTFSDSGDRLAAARIDRFSIGYSTENFVLRAGRQALSWGGGLFYAPMDLVNPFDPAAIDTEYKTGDDMLYAQYLFDTGADIEFAHVVRRDPVSDRVTGDQSSTLAKYRTRFGELDIDVMAGRHYGDAVAAVSLAGNLTEAVWRSDLVVTDADDGEVVQWLVNASYSWVAFSRNMTGSAEFFYNGFGVTDVEAIETLPVGVSSRLARGDLFTIGRRYAAANVTVELTPLLNLSASAFTNLDDPSGLLQLGLRYSLSDNDELLGFIGVPLGPAGTEFGGLESLSQAAPLRRGPSLFLQLAHYF